MTSSGRFAGSANSRATVARCRSVSVHGSSAACAGTVERIACRAAPSGGLPLEVLPTLVVAGEPDDVERVEDFNRVGDGPPDGALVAGERASTVRT